MNEPAVPVSDDHPIEASTDPISPARKRLGRVVIWVASALFALVVLLQILNAPA